MVKKSNKKSSKSKRKQPPVLETDEISLPIPEHGWVAEYDKCRKAVKTSPGDAHLCLRLVQAASELRRWDKVVKLCQTVKQAGQNFEGSVRDSMHQLRVKAKATIRKTRPSAGDEAFLRPYIETRLNVDTTHCRTAENSATNLNLLHMSASLTNVDWLDLAVAIGAAIDFPILAKDEGGSSKSPPTTTALLIAASTLVTCSHVGPNWIPNQATVESNSEEVCGLLLMFSADASLRIQSPEGLCLGRKLYDELRLEGKSIAELIAMSNKPKLQKILKETSNDPDHRFCRCGSRQLWYNCHGNKSLIKHFPFFHDANDGSRYWRLSPMARCPCDNTDELYIDCCWSKSTSLALQNDKTGNL